MKYHFKVIIKYAGSVNNYNKFLEILKPYRRNTWLDGFSVIEAHPSVKTCEAMLTISSRSLEKAITTLDFILIDLSYYCGLSLTLYTKSIKQYYPIRY